MTTAAPGTLYEALCRIPDHRKARGKVYPLPSLLTFAVTAMLCGAKSKYAIAQFGRDYNHLAPAFGFTRPHARRPARYRTPSVGELHTVFAALDHSAFEAVLAAWVIDRGVKDLPDRLVNIDGKTLRGSQGHQLPGVQLVAAWCPDVEAVLAQLRVPDATNEHKTALGLLKLMPLEGAVVTGDAAFTQKDFCEAVIDGGGDYFVFVKENQPTLLEDIKAGFRKAFSPSGAPTRPGDRHLRRDAQQGARADRDAAAAGDGAAQRLPGLAGGAAGVRHRAGAAYRGQGGA
jgi:hypothetical protein